MTDKTVVILCEGPACNGGRSAKDREASLIGDGRGISEQLREEANRHARSTVSRALRYTLHSRVGVGKHGTSLYACEDCTFERVYGNTLWVL